MADEIPMIDVPGVEDEAYNHDRPISSLIHNQLIHLSVAEQTLPKAKRSGVNIATLHTEREAADYIQRVTALLHPGGRPKKAAKPRAKKTANQARSSGATPEAGTTTG